jgi:hypothetical protein
MATDLKARAIDFLQQAASGRAHAKAATHWRPASATTTRTSRAMAILLTAMDKNAAQFPDKR